jgi:hypothetical protein
LPVGVVKWANHRSTWLSNELNRSGSAPKPDEPASVDGSTDDRGAMREGVGEVGGVVVLGAGGPWGRPHGSMEILTVRQVSGA